MTLFSTFNTYIQDLTSGLLGKSYDKVNKSSELITIFEIKNVVHLNYKNVLCYFFC